MTIANGGDTAFSSTTDATAPTVGSIVTAGGIGVGKTIWAGGDIVAFGPIVFVTAGTNTLIEHSHT